MATTGRKISALDTIDADALTSGDMFLVLDTGNDLRKIDADDMLDAISTPFTRTMVDDLTAGATLTTLGFSAFAQTLVDDADLATWLNTMGMDGDLATLTLDDNVTISAFGATILDDTDYATLHSTLGLEDWPGASRGEIGTKTACSSGTSVEFLNDNDLIDEACKITILFKGISCDTDDAELLIQMNQSTSGWKTGGYSGVSAVSYSANKFEEAGSGGHQCNPDTYWDDADTIFGIVFLQRLGNDDIWRSWGHLIQGTTDQYWFAYFVTLAEFVDGLRIKTQNDYDFDGGTALVQAFIEYGAR